MINICKVDELEEVIKRRKVIFDQMQVDMKLHPNSVRKHKATEVIARCYSTPAHKGAGCDGCENAIRLVKAYDRSANII